MDRELLRCVKRDLPNFPEPVIESWLIYYAERYGWPPDHLGWSGIFLDLPLSTWASLTWRTDQVDLQWGGLHPETRSHLQGMYGAYVFGEGNAYAINPTGPTRFRGILEYVSQNGLIPEPAVALELSEGLKLADGYHRILALCAYLGILPGSTPTVAAPVRRAQPFWLAS